MIRLASFIFAMLISMGSFEAYACRTISVGGILETQEYKLEIRRYQGCNVQSLFQCGDGKRLISVTESRDSQYIYAAVTCKKEITPIANPNRKVIPSSGEKELSSLLSGPAVLPKTASLGTDSVPANIGKLTPGLTELAKKEGLHPSVLQKAYNLYQSRKNKNHTKRGCFMAGDLTLPKEGKLFLVCLNPEKVVALKTVVGAGQGDGCYSHPYSNQTECGKYFGSRSNYCLSMGGAFSTGLAVRTSGSRRTFVELNGLEEYNSNAKSRQVGLMQAIDRAGNRIESPRSHGAFIVNDDLSKFDIQDLGFNDEGRELSMYIYPSAQDIQDVIRGKEGAYWNSTCLAKIQKPGWIGKDEFFLDKEASKVDEFKFMNEYTQEPTPSPTEKVNSSPIESVD